MRCQLHYILEKFRDKWPQLKCHELQLQESPLIPCSIWHSATVYPGSTYTTASTCYHGSQELFQLAELTVGLPSKTVVKKPVAMRRARWMATPIYSLDLQLLFAGNESKSAFQHNDSEKLVGIKIGLFVYLFFKRLAFAILHGEHCWLTLGYNNTEIQKGSYEWLWAIFARFKACC